MITRISINLRDHLNANDNIVAIRCDCCDGEFGFMGLNLADKVFPLVGGFFGDKLVKFCPYCGARNTQPRPMIPHV